VVVAALGAVQSVYWYSPCQYPVPCFTAPKRYPLATCSGWQARWLPIILVPAATVLSCPHIYLFCIYASPDHPATSWLHGTGSHFELRWRHTPFSGWCHNLDNSESVRNCFSAQ